MRDPGGAIWTYTYDLVGNRLTASDPDLGVWSYVYDSADRLISQTDARGVVTTLSYDQMGRLLTKKVKGTADSAATVTTSNTYDDAPAGVGASPFHNVGLLTQSANDNAIYMYSKRMTGSETVSTAKVEIDGIVHTATERTGRTGKTRAKSYAPISLNVGSSAQPWVYDESDRLTTIPGYIDTISYQADGQTASISYANGVKTTFTYSATRGWLTRVRTVRSSTVLLDNTYTRDSLGRITKVQGRSAVESWNYEYDDLGRLISADNLGNSALDEVFSYSASGNLLSRTRMSGSYTYPAGSSARPHAPTKIGTQTIRYDANGNMVSDGVRTLVWGRSNQLEKVTISGAATSLLYGPDGARVQKISPSSNILQVGADIEIDRTTPGADVYTRYPHPDLKLVSSNGETVTHFLHRDHLASVRVVTGATGATLQYKDYAAYGEITKDQAFGEATNEAMKAKKGYIGERYDPETGLMYLNARYYDPAFGRFVPPDDLQPANNSMRARCRVSCVSK